MADYGNRYVVNDTYRSARDADKDEFQARLNGSIDTEIRGSGRIRAIVSPKTSERELFVLVSTTDSSQKDNP